jgi:endo-1,3-1,4-beta-glycanase ExoK
MNKLLASVLFAQGISANDFISGEVKTTETFQYGKFITRMKAGNHNGTVASFFTYWNGPNWSDGQWNEIDVEIVPSEMIKHVEPFSTNIIYGSGTNYHK